MKKTKEQGVTLIALAVTIIVLLILAAVSLAMVLGQDGIFKKAEVAVEVTNESQELDQVRIAALEARTNSIADKTDLKTELQTSINKVYPGSTVTQNGEEYTITLPNGHVYTMINNVVNKAGDEEEEVPVAVTETWYKVEGTTVHFSNSDLGGYTQQTTMPSEDNLPGWINELQANDNFEVGSIHVVLENEMAPNNTAYWFYGAGSISSKVNGTEVANSLENLNTINVTDMSSMFTAANISSIDLTKLNTKNVTNMKMMFGMATGETIDISSWDTSNVTNIDMMFAMGNVKNINMSGLNLNRLTTMATVFQNNTSLESVNFSNIEANNLEAIGSMFVGDSNLTTADFSNFHAPNLKILNYFFYTCTSLVSVDLTNFDTRNVTQTTDMFLGCDKLESVTVTEGLWTLTEAECDYDGEFNWV